MSPGRAGLVLTLAVGLLGFAFGGSRGVVAAGSFGLLATVIQVVAGRAMRRQAGRAFRDFARAWASGMGLRFLGVLLLGVVIWLDAERFPPVPAAMGYIGVLVPLLFLEARRV